ncbi:MAG: P-loop NTPase, partial [Planctomycetota bacterium]
MPEQTLSKDYVTRVLTTVDAPDGPTAGQDLVTAGILQWISACDGYASVRLSLPEAGDAPADQTAMVHLAGEADRAIRAAARRDGIAVNDLRFIFVDHSGNIVFRAGKGPDDPDAAPAGAESGQDHALPQRGAQQQPNRPPDRPQATANALPGVKKIVAVGAGKGGVGKSSVAVNLAVGLARAGHAVGLLDGDIYGPSLPTMLGLDSHEQAVMDGKLVPHAVHGVKAVTIGKLVEPEKPLIWRGPMAHGAFQQLTTRTA